MRSLPRASAAALLTTTLLLTAVTLPEAARAQAPGAPAAEIVHEIARLDSLWLNAYVTRDVEAVRRVLADDFVGQLGPVLADKDAMLARVAESTVVEMDLERLEVNVFGDVATAHAIRRSITRTEDGTVESRFAYTDVYRWQEGRWVSFTGQSAQLPSSF